MELKHAADFKSQRGNADYFTGEVWIEGLIMGGPMSVKSVRVTFTPGARTAWHTHPAGQVLYITSGRGWVQKEGEAPQAITTGDVVVFAPNEKHWHGAAADSPMTHIALQPIVDGIDSNWLEQVSPEHYPTT